MKVRFFSIAIIIFLSFSLFSCLGGDPNLNISQNESQIDMVAQRFLKASARVMVVSYYEAEKDPGIKKSGLLEFGFGSGYIYGAEHYLFTNHHVIEVKESKTLDLVQETPLGPMTGQAKWKLKKTRYFLADCQKLNNVKKLLSKYLEAKKYQPPDLYSENDGRLYSLKFINEDDFDNFFTENEKELKTIFEFYVNPDTYYGDETADSACVRLAHLDGQLNYVNMSDHAVGEKLRLGQTIYVWGAPYMFIEQFYKGVIANPNIKSMDVFEDKFNLDNFALIDAPFAPGSSGSMIFYINDKGEGKILGLVSFVFPPPPFSCGNAFVRIDPFLESLGFLKKP